MPLDEQKGESKPPTRSILYYPTINIPNSTWLRQAIFYWDGVRSIVPEKFLLDDGYKFSPEIEFLLKEGEFRTFDPQALLATETRWEFEKEFKSLIRRQVLCEDNTDKKQTFSVNSSILKEKVSTGVYEFLENHKLARPRPNRPDWYLFETRTALLYMSLLAQYLSKICRDFTVPGTDRKEYENIVMSCGSEDKSKTCLVTRLVNLLPVPREDQSFEDIIHFKQKRRQALLEFRTFLDESQESLAEAEDQTDLMQKLVACSEKCEKELAKLQKLSKDHNIELAWGSLKTLIDVKSPTVWIASAVATGAATTMISPPLGVVSAGLAIAGTIQVGHNIVVERNKRKQELRNSPFSYLYHANKEGVL